MRFTDADVLAFAEATGDRNPLHLSAEYSRATPYGRPVVFGVLGALRLLAAVPRAPRPTRLRAAFSRPLFPGVDYEVGAPEGSLVSILEGGEQLAWLLTETAGEAQAHEPVDRSAVTTDMRAEAVDDAIDERRIGSTTQARYACDPAALRRLAGDPLSAWTDVELAAVGWVSYLAGMEIPGKQALLLGVDLDLEPVDASGPLTYDVRLQRLDERYRLATVTGELYAGSRLVARARVRALVRPGPRREDVAAEHRPVNADRFQGCRAVVVGGSRGVGAALVALLAAAGAEVTFTYAVSVERAERLADRLRAQGASVTAVRADAREPRGWQAVAPAGGVDLLVCSAWPALQRLPHAAESVDAAVAHVGDGLAMVATPLLALLPELRPGSDVVVLSSQLVSEPEPGFWHYASGKAAVEQLCRSVAARATHTQFVLARPPALDTEYVHTFGARALPAVQAARVILEHCRVEAPGVREIAAGSFERSEVG